MSKCRWALKTNIGSLSPLAEFSKRCQFPIDFSLSKAPIRENLQSAGCLWLGSGIFSPRPGAQGGEVHDRAYLCKFLARIAFRQARPIYLFKTNPVRQKEKNQWLKNCRCRYLLHILGIRPLRTALPVPRPGRDREARRDVDTQLFSLLVNA